MISNYLRLSVCGLLLVSSLRAQFHSGLSSFSLALSQSPNTRAPQTSPPRMMHLLSNTDGWVLTGEQLLWTSDAGKHWQEITPPKESNQSIDSVFFLDSLHGWSVLHSVDSAGRATITVASSLNGGHTWSSSPVKAANIDENIAPAYSGGGDLSFINPKQGWLLLGQVSSSASSIGYLYKTTDGGANWSALPAPPVAGEIRFQSPTIGWLVGGAAGDYLYSTTDGGQSWAEVILPQPEGLQGRVEVRCSLPTFQDAQRGLLPVRFVPEGRSFVLATYSTTDGGNHWKLQAKEVHSSFGYSIAPSIVGDKIIKASIWKGKVITHSDALSGALTALPSELPPSLSIRKAHFTDTEHGWILVSGSQCASFKSNCSTTTMLLATEDGGKTFSPVLRGTRQDDIPNINPPNSPQARPQSLLVTPNTLAGGHGPNGAYPPFSRTLAQYQGMDSCGNMPLTAMQDFWNSSTYYSVGFYLGGATTNRNNCFKPDFNWINATSCMGWVYTPVWDDLQAPCAPGVTQFMSSNATTAAQQGDAAAEAAANALAYVGLTYSIAYLDLEHYPTGDSQCSQAVRAYVNSWVVGMNIRGYAAGVYGNADDANQDWDWFDIANPPNDIWIASYPGLGMETSLLPPVNNSDWQFDQRIHQYCCQGNYYETHGTSTLKIDQNIVDACVAQVWQNSCCTDPCDSLCPNYDPTLPSCQPPPDDCGDCNGDECEIDPTLDSCCCDCLHMCEQ